jgi:hypothetical protein
MDLHTSDKESLLKLNPEKCQFFQEEVPYLGHIVTPERITTDPEKLEAVWEWPTPKNKHRIRRLLGLCNYYQLFFRFRHIAKLLTVLTKDKQAFQWILLETACLIRFSGNV